MSKKEHVSLKGKDLDEVTVQSLRCKLSMGELITLFRMLDVEFTKDGDYQFAVKDKILSRSDTTGRSSEFECGEIVGSELLIKKKRAFYLKA